MFSRKEHNDTEYLNPEYCCFQPGSSKPGNVAEVARDCRCITNIPAQPCQLTLDGKGLRHSLVQRQHQIGLIAYIRVTGNESDAQRQLALIQEYCSERGYYVARAFEDRGKPGIGLAEAMDALTEAYGLIAVDLNRFVDHSADRLRDLRPFVHHFFCHMKKHLITLEEGIDTGSPGGQISAVELVNQLREAV